MDEKEQIKNAQEKAAAKNNVKDSRFVAVTVVVVTVIDKVTGIIVDKTETTSSEYT